MNATSIGKTDVFPMKMSIRQSYLKFLLGLSSTQGNLDLIAEGDDDHFIIFSDSLSVLLSFSLHHKKTDNSLLLNILHKLHHLSCAHKTIHFCWIPSHIGILGNEAAMAAKESLYQDIMIR